jgi:hypothetical protein
MCSCNHNAAKRQGERGATLYIFTASLFLLVGMGALAIDLASMYVARNQSQRAADATALAGAKYFAESGCVTNGNCAAFETTAIARATEVAAKSNVEGQAVTIVGTPTFNIGTATNPQITVSVQSANLNLYFLPALAYLASVVGTTGSVPTPITVGATATAEAYNPSGNAGGPTYCTGCVRPWLIPNCDQTIAAAPNPLCNSATPSPEAYLLTPGSYSVANPGCYPGGVIGEPIEIPLPTPTTPASMTTLYGALDVDNPGIANFFDYQGTIPICSTTQPTTGQTTCGVYPGMNILPIGPTPSLLGTSTINGVDSLLHLAPGATGIIGQDTIVSGSCPVQIQAGSVNPIVVQGIVGSGTLIATSDSIVTAYIYDTPPATVGYTGLSYNTTTDTPQTVSIVGFAQIFVSQVDATGNIFGNILGVAGCGSNPNAACGLGSGNGTSINGPTLIPVRLITPGN